MKKSALAILCLLVLQFRSFNLTGQYEENPLKGKRWLTVSAGLNDADYLSWNSAVSYSKRGETILTQVKLAYTQELIIAPNDSCTDRRNRLTECDLIWGDGWSGKRWFLSGGAGFGLNVRMFCRRGDYENEYITAVTVGVPIQAEFGLKLGKHAAITFVGSANLNFREPYFGGGIGYTSFFNTKK